MSISKKIVEHVFADNGEKVRSSIYKSINEKVADLLESKKIELAGGSLVSEENIISEEAEYILDEMIRTETKIEKLKEQIAVLEAESCGMSDDEDDEDDDDDEEKDYKLEKKKKKLAKKEKKMEKLKEAFALLESEEGEIDETGEWSEEDEESEEESEDENN